MKAYTDLEQSKKLAEILLIESADHHYVRKTCDCMGNPVDGKWSIPKYGNPNSKHANYMVQNFTSYETLPCWSLVALLDYLLVNQGVIVKSLDKQWEVDCIVHVEYNKELVDACVEMIIELHKQKLLRL